MTGKNILMVAIGESHRASSRFRVWQMAPMLQMEGHNTKIVTYIKNIGSGGMLDVVRRKLYSLRVAEAEIESNIEWADVIFIQEALLSFRLLDKIEKSGKKVIFDFSDPIHLIGEQLGLSLFRKLVFKYMERPKFDKTLKIATHAVVENESLQDICKQFGCETHVVRGPIDCSHYKPVDKQGCEEFVIGWTGSPATFGLLEPILPLIDQLGEKKSLRLLLIGCGERNLKLKNVPVSIVPWSLELEKKLVPTFDVGLFNLKDTLWDCARGGGKLFVYMSCGVPFIGPNLGVASQVFDESKAGVLVEGVDQWAIEFDSLINDPERRELLSHRAREFAQKNYSQEACIEVWHKFL
jgi:glycosyltransferase involved in cell wall biosynthesis